MTEPKPSSLMTFENVLSDYFFFQQHITEITEMRRHFGLHLSRWDFKQTPIQYLDFGCGDGSIPEALERNVANLHGRTQFSIVEPTEAQRHAAVGCLTKSSQGEVIAAPYLADLPPRSYDFILASHSLYYVPDLKETIQALYERLNDNALFIIAMECSDSPTKKIWEVFFKSIQRPIPYHLSDHVRSALEQLNINYEIDPLRARMEFPDTTENRRHIARFLLEPYYSLEKNERILSFFDPFSKDGEIKAEMRNDLYIIEKK